jgi:DNA-directed RNA polymerase I subunit RPA2
MKAKTKSPQRSGGSSSKSGKTTTATTVAVQTCPSFRGGHLPAVEDAQRLQTLTAPHVNSFNYFLEHGLSAGIHSIEAVELDLIDPKLVRDGAGVNLSDTSTLQFWMENVSIGKPTKPAPSGRSNGSRLLPREARERGLMYSGTITGTFCHRLIERRNGVVIPNKVHRLVKTFGDMPIMVLSNACHLQGMTPVELSKLREEVRCKRWIRT